MTAFLRNPLVRNVFAMLIFSTCFVMIMISLVAHTERSYRRRLRVRRSRWQAGRQELQEYEDEFNAEVINFAWQEIHRSIAPLAERSSPTTTTTSTTTTTAGPTPRPRAVVLSNAENGSADGDVTEAYGDEAARDADGGGGDRRLLTLFTTMKNADDRLLIHLNTIANWAALGPHVRPVLFAENATDGLLVKDAARRGWRVLNVTRWNNGIPTVKHMFLAAIGRFSSTFYGYANADILFDRTLVANLKSFARYGDDAGRLFIIGKRSNANVSSPALRLLDAANLTQVAELGKRNASLFATNAQDYFVTTRRAFPWRRIPDLVVGRAGYDNWLVIKAQDWNLTVVDASYTLVAIHQTGMDGNRAGWAEKTSRCLNREIIGIFNYTRGHTKCVPYISYTDLAGEIRIFRRPRISRDCQPRRRAKYQALMGCV